MVRHIFSPIRCRGLLGVLLQLLCSAPDHKWPSVRIAIAYALGFPLNSAIIIKHVSMLDGDTFTSNTHYVTSLYLTRKEVYRDQLQAPKHPLGLLHLCDQVCKQVSRYEYQLRIQAFFCRPLRPRLVPLLLLSSGSDDIGGRTSFSPYDSNASSNIDARGPLITPFCTVLPQCGQDNTR